MVTHQQSPLVEPMMEEDRMVKFRLKSAEKAKCHGRTKPGAVICCECVRIAVWCVWPCDRERLHAVSAGRHALRISDVVPLLQHEG